MKQHPKYYYTVSILIIIVYALCNFYCTTRLSVTGDESNYYNYGTNILKFHPQKDFINGVYEYTSQMPIIAINTLPRAFSQLLNPGLKHNQFETLEDVTQSRLFSIIIAVLLAWYILLWSTKLYGKKAGVFSLLLYVLCPNMLAHSQMVSTDVYSFLLCTATFYHAWQYSRSGNIIQLLLVALMLGIGQISKQSLLLLYPLVLIFLVVRLYYSNLKWKDSFFKLVKELSIIAVVSLFVINCGFLFYKSGKTFGQYHFYSAKFINYQKQFSFINNLPLPVPEPYIAGFDNVAFNLELPPGIDGVSAYGASYFLGERITGKLIISYYTICCLYKLPISFLFFLLTSLVLFFKKFDKPAFIKNELFLLFPAAAIFLCFSFLNSMYLGIRNILFILPLLFIFCGYLIKYLSDQGIRFAYWIAGILLLYQFVSVATYFPHFLPYTNEFIYNKKNAYKIFGDANIYFQEGAILAKEYLLKHPEIQYEPTKLVHGKVMVSLENYLDFWYEGKVQWLINLKLEPIDHFHSGYLIFQVP